MSKKNKAVFGVEPQEPIEPTKNTKEEIEAALARACGNKVDSVDAFDCSKNKIGRDAPKVQDTTSGEDQCNINSNEPIAISAKDCLNESKKNQDSTIVEYINGINSRIKKECQSGGYSTNITFRVMPSQWVNVQHIVDWYRSNGFEVIMGESTHPQYGQSAGTIEYNFMITWVNA